MEGRDNDDNYLEDMFGGFEDLGEKKKKKKKSKRKAERQVDQLEEDVKKEKKGEKEGEGNIQQKEQQIQDDADLDFMDYEEDALLKEGEALSSLAPDGGFRESDYQYERNEFQNCIHEFVAPAEYQRPHYRRPEMPAKTYTFKLDRFQEKAVECIERGESVLVAAHTSAGKTAVAEYAIAKALKQKQRVIYTSPIKALSNQKYRELLEEFQDVGLMTGDVTLNEGASCLVMTTEILRSMLYRGSEVTREMAWVIFDEVHYMRDKERGVVWEETIIMLPLPVRNVFLSATIPNAKEFAQWIVKVKQQPCNVVYTDFRPVPLQHYMCPSGGEGLYLVVDEKGQFKEQNFAKAVSILESDLSLDKILDERKNKRGGPQKATQAAEIKTIVTLIAAKGLDPCIVFSFSKRDCEAYALALKGCDFNVDQEKEQIEQIFNNAVGTLSEEDQNLPQISTMLQLLKRGIGIHHGGLYPLIKEVVEILFQESLLKVLFTTETFSMGINMPAKTVVFTSIEKFDGDQYRWISGGEFIQMSGRAGRRGLDDRGVTIMMANKKLEPEVAKSIFKGQSDPLYSTFHLGYNMLLNMMRAEGVRPENLILKSFHQFQNERALPEMKAKLDELLQQYSQMSIPDEDLCKRKRKLEQQCGKVDDEIRRVVMKPENLIPFLVPGRLVRIKHEQQDFGWGLVVNFQKQKINAKMYLLAREAKHQKFIDMLKENDTHFIVDVFLFVRNKLSNENVLTPCDVRNRSEGKFGVVPVVLHHSNFHSISSIQLNMPHNLKEAENNKVVENMFFELMRRFDYGNSLPLLHPIEDMEIEGIDKLWKKKEQIQGEIQSQKLASISSTHQEMFSDKQVLKEKIRSLEQSIRKSAEMIMKQDLVNMMRVMRRLDLCDSHDQPMPKGKVACCISAADELLTTELLFSGQLSQLEPAVVAAVLSSLVYKDAKASEQKITKDERLVKPYQALKETADRVASVMIECKIPLDREEYLKQFNPDLMELTLKWCQGAKFKEVCEMVENIYEGTIIRALRRLDELLSQLVEGAKVIGNEDLKEKFEQAQKLLKRGIVFTASLYL